MTGPSSNSDLSSHNLNDYSKWVAETDEKANKSFQQLIKQVQTILWVNLTLYVLAFLLTIVLLFACFTTLLTSDQFEYKQLINIGGGSVGLIMLFVLLIRNPAKMVSQPIKALKIHFINIGFSRQVRQIDITYKQAISLGKTSEELPGLMQQLQVVLEETIDQVNNVIEEMD